GDRRVALQEFADPTPRADEVVLEIKASGMCGSDLKFYRAAPGEAAKSLGLGDASAVIAGHEPCGVVAAVGTGRQVTVIGSWTFSTVGQAECATFIADRKIAVDHLFTDRWTLEQAAEAYRLFDRQTSGKGVFLF